MLICANSFVNMKHYICKGGCGGVADKEGVCQTADCPDFSMPLQQCDCIDGKHGMSEEEEEAFLEE